MPKSSKRSAVKRVPVKCTFGKMLNVALTYEIDRGHETHTKIIDMPSPFHGKLVVDDVLEPSEYILLEFKGIHDSHYMGINYVKFYDGDGKKVEYENVAVDGKEVDHADVKPAMPVNGWWAVVGEEHSLLFRFKDPNQRIKTIDLMCANASASPKFLHVSDGKQPADINGSSFHRDCVFQLAGDRKDPTDLKFLLGPKEKVTFSNVIAKYNEKPPKDGFHSLFSSCEKYLFVFYRKGLRTRAYNYFFGKNPTEAFNLATSITPSSTGSIIKKVEQRAMTLLELQAVRSVIISSCVKDKWKSCKTGHQLRPEDVNLYDLNTELVNPITKKRNCSFKELFQSGGSNPTFYTSHWWGDSVLDFVRCCEYHAGMNGLEASKVKYWVCAYASRQHDLGEGLAVKPDESAFRKAMKAAQGLLLIIDPKNTVYKRTWVDFELYKTIKSKHSTVDMVTHDSGVVHILADKSLHGEGPYQRLCRERNFPYSRVCKGGLTVTLEQGSTSMEIDKIRILNTMAENTELDDAKILTAVDPVKMKLYQKANYTLRSELALRCFSAALMTEGQSLESFHGHDLLDIVSSDKTRTKLKIEQPSIDAVTDADFGKLVGLARSNTEDLHMNFVGCDSLTDNSLLTMKLPVSLKKLHMGFGISKKFTNEGVIELTTTLPQKLTTLSLDVRAHKKSDGSFAPSRRNSHLEAIGNNLPQSLLEFKLKTNLDSTEDGSGLNNLAKALPRTLKNFSLSFEVWDGFKGRYMTTMATNLPMSLETLVIYSWGGGYWESQEIGRFATEIMKLKNLKECSVFTSDSGKSGYYRQRKFKSVDELSKHVSPLP